MKKSNTLAALARECVAAFFQIPIEKRTDNSLAGCIQAYMERAICSVEPQIGSWMDIDSAPKDGSMVLVAHVYGDGSYMVSVASWWINQWASLGSRQITIISGMLLAMVPLDDQPHLWMPLTNLPGVKS